MCPTVSELSAKLTLHMLHPDCLQEKEDTQQIPYLLVCQVNF